MPSQIPIDMLPFVERMVAERRFVSTEEVLAEGLRLLKAREELRDDIKRGFEELDVGKCAPADEVYARVEERIDQIEREGRYWPALFTHRLPRTIYLRSLNSLPETSLVPLAIGLRRLELDVSGYRPSRISVKFGRELVCPIVGHLVLVVT